MNFPLRIPGPSYDAVGRTYTMECEDCGGSGWIGHSVRNAGEAYGELVEVRCHCGGVAPTPLCDGCDEPVSDGRCDGCCVVFVEHLGDGRVLV